MPRRLTVAGLCSLTMASALLLLSGCSLDCDLSATARTFLDQNENGVWDAGESPLPDVQCFMESSQGVAIGEATSDLNGDARLQVMQAGCPKGAVFWVYAEPPPGYRLTTLARLTGREPAQQPFLFGFVIPQQGSATPAATAGYAPVATATGTPLATPSSTPTRRPTRTPSPTSTPAPPTGTLLLASTPVAVPDSVLVYTEWLDGQIALAQVDVEGRIRLVSEPGRAPRRAWYSQPLGAWMAYDVEWEDGHQVRVVLYNSRTGVRQEIPIPYGVSVWGPTVDADGGRVAYTLLAAVGEHVDGTHRWVTYVHDLATGTVTGFGAEWPSPQDKWFFGGEPIAWVGDTLLIEMFCYCGEGYLGVWALDTGRGIPGETVTLSGYDWRVLDSALASATGWYYSPTVSPDGEMLAFLIHDSDYDLPCWHPAFFGEEHLTAALGVVPTRGGKPRLLLDVAAQGRDLAGFVAWSPDSRQILFVEGPCQDEPSPVALTLRAVDLDGTVMGEWPLPPLDPSVYLSVLWCAPDGIYYDFQRNDRDELWRLDPATGRSQLVLTADRLGLAGCLP